MQPKLNRRQEAHLVSLIHSGEYSTAEVAEHPGDTSALRPDPPDEPPQAVA